MADLSAGLFTSLLAIQAADTGAGGLNESGATAAARINRFVQRGDPNYEEGRAEFWPLVVVDIIERGDIRWGNSSANASGRVLVRMTLTTLRDTARAPQNAVNARMRVRFNGITPSAQTGWTYGYMVLEQVYQLRASATTITLVHEYSLMAGVTGADLTSAQSSLTFTGSEGAAIGTTLRGEAIDENIEVVVADVEYFYDQAERLTRRGFRGTITGVFTIQSMTPVVPVGTQGVLVVFENTAGNRRITYTNAVVVQRRFSASGSNPQKLFLTFRVSSTGRPGALPAVAS